MPVVGFEPNSSTGEPPDVVLIVAPNPITKLGLKVTSKLLSAQLRTTVAVKLSAAAEADTDAENGTKNISAAKAAIRRILSFIVFSLLGMRRKTSSRTEFIHGG